MEIASLLRKAEDLLPVFLNKPVIDILAISRSDAMRPNNLANLIIDTIPVYDMLRNPETRNILIRVMSEQEAKNFAEFIGITKWEDVHCVHYKLTHAKFSKKILEKALEFFGEEYNEEPIINRAAIETISPEKYLFPYQVSTVKNLHDKLSKPPHKALLHMPTGSGKTMSAMRIVLLQLLETPDALVIWLAHNEELCEQAMEEFQRMWKAAGDREITTYRFFGRSKLNPLEAKSGFMSAGLLKMLSSASKNTTFLSEIAQKTKLVVIDEAHQSPAEKFSIVIEELAENKNTKLLGLSATPGRKSDALDNANRRLARFFAGHKVMLDSGQENPITFLIKECHLASPKFNNIKHAGERLSKEDLIRIERNVDIPKSILEKISADTIRNLAIVGEIMRLHKTHKKIIVFASHVKHAKTVSLILSAKKLNSNFVTSKTPPGIRSQMLHDFKNTDKPMILCNYGILTTGFDAPKTSAIVIARPTKSYVLYAQMVGRGIRGPKAGGNETCEISTIIDDDIAEFINITEIFTQWESVWND